MDDRQKVEQELAEEGYDVTEFDAHDIEDQGEVQAHD